MDVLSICFYCYVALVTNIVDGDSLMVTVKDGFDSYTQHVPIDIWDIEGTPESRTYLKDNLLHKRIVIKTVVDKRNRHNTEYYAKVYTWPDGVDVGQALLDLGLAMHARR